VLRADLEGNGSTLLHEGRWGNANIVKVVRDGNAWIVKDFLHCWLPVRHIWGRAMVANELRALNRLAGIRGIPESPFRVDPFAFGYRFVEGMTLRHADRDRITTSYFLELESLVREMHARGIAHLDLRNKRNVLITAQGHPAMIDFQSAVRLERCPTFLRPLMRQVDLSGVYKHWEKFIPGSMGRERAELLARHEAIRRFWFLRGYAGIKRSHSHDLTDAHAAGAHGKR